MLIRKPGESVRAGFGEEQLCVNEACGHADCSDVRAKAASKCMICSKYIGYARPFRDNPDGSGLVHQACLDRDARVYIARNILIKTRTTKYYDQLYRLYLSCGHEEVIRLRSREEEGKVVSRQRMPKTLHCITCAKQKRDQYGRRREDADWLKLPKSLKIGGR